jgi:hypothetical protein
MPKFEVSADYSTNFKYLIIHIMQNSWRYLLVSPQVSMNLRLDLFIFEKFSRHPQSRRYTLEEAMITATSPACANSKLNATSTRLYY